MKQVILALLLAATLAFCFFYEPPARAALIHVEIIHVVEYWENAEEIARQYLSFNKEFNDVGAFAAAIRRANGFRPLVPGMCIKIPLAYEKK